MPFRDGDISILVQNMCKAIEEMMDDAREEVREELKEDKIVRK